MAVRRIPFGAWPSDLAADAVAEGSLRLGGLALEDGFAYWTESRAGEGGRMALVRKREGGEAVDVVPAPFSVRTRVHEYGGGAFAVQDGLVIFANDSDQQLYRIDTRQPGPWQPRRLTSAEGMRFADLQIDAHRRRVLCVGERKRADDEPENFIAGVDLTSGAIDRLVSGADFYAFPRMNGAGDRLAFLRWDHPAMPWEATWLDVAHVERDGAVGAATTVAGGESESVFQPAWSPAGELCFISDRTGFSNLYRLNADGSATNLCSRAADFATPLWVFGVSTYAWLDPRTIACLFQESGLWKLGLLTPKGLQVVAMDLTELGMLFADRGRALLVGGSAAHAPAFFALDGEGTLTLVHRPSPDLLPEAAVARPHPVSFPTSGGAIAHGLLYLPQHPDCQGPPDELPPLLVVCHGGPTGSTSSALSLTTQFWTSRGFAVLDVNYRGSTGFGRAYRKALDGQWGIVDVDDCVAGARRLAEEGIVDGKRMVIRGSSAGGFTVLCALTFHDVFAAGASYYGVSDLESLAHDTHKFESRYLDSLIGPYPERRDLYQARSPIHAADRLHCPVIFFQGLEDRVVPPAQAENMVAALRRQGIQAPLVAFPDEQHGFRRKESIIRALNAELAFYREVLRITPDPDRPLGASAR